MYKTAINNRGETTLYSAVYNKADIEIVKMLLDKGVDVNAQDSQGRTALFWAAFSGQAETVQALLDKGADVNIKDSDGSTVFNFAREPKILEMLNKHATLG